MKKHFLRYKLLISSPLIGLFITIGLFFLEGFPVWGATTFLLLSFLTPFLLIVRSEKKIMNDQLEIIRHTKRSYVFVGRILNDRGDFESRERKRITKTGGPPITYLEKNYIKSKANKLNLRPPRVIESKPKRIKLIERYKSQFVDEVPIDNELRKFICLDYAYKLSKPLIENGDFIEYEIILLAEGHTKKAFLPDGDVEGCFISMLNESVKMNLIAPSGYCINMLDYWIQNESGDRIGKLFDKLASKPEIINNNSSLTWEISYPIINHYYLFRYNLNKI